MPLYDYRCSECGRVVEVMHGIHDGGPQVCEACGGPMKKALSPPAIHFKGSGWAKKDAASAASTRSKPETKTDGAAAGKAGSDGTAAKPASGDAKAASASGDAAASDASGGASD